MCAERARSRSMAKVKVDGLGSELQSQGRRRAGALDGLVVDGQCALGDRPARPRGRRRRRARPGCWPLAQSEGPAGDGDARGHRPVLLAKRTDVLFLPIEREHEVSESISFAQLEGGHDSGPRGRVRRPRAARNGRRSSNPRVRESTSALKVSSSCTTSFPVASSPTRAPSRATLRRCPEGSTTVAPTSTGKRQGA